MIDGYSSLRSRDNLPPTLSKFSHINRYWDPHQNSFAAKILPGQYYVTLHGEIVVTVLGSCVSACVRDKNSKIGGMNHFMLPGAEMDGIADARRKDAYGAERYGIYAMESLINEILKNGGRRENLEVKITGGGRVLNNLSDIGKRNIDFVRHFVEDDGLTLVGEDVGDIYPRKVYYYPETGKVRVKKLIKLNNMTIFNREDEYKSEIQECIAQSDVVFFKHGNDIKRK